MWFSLMIKLTKQYHKILKKYTDSDTKKHLQENTQTEVNKIERKAINLSTIT